MGRRRSSAVGVQLANMALRGVGDRTPNEDVRPPGGRQDGPLLVPGHPGTFRPVESRRIRITLQYDGSDFHGWQVQPGVRTVQGEVDRALSRLADRPTRCLAAGRTDTGVHATGQVVSVSMPAKWTPEALHRSLNALLPEDVWAADVTAAAPDFHARYSATARGYIYRVGTTPAARSPFRRGWCWALGEPLDRDALDTGAAAIVGSHSFRGYAKSGQPERGYDCTVLGARWRAWPGSGLELGIVANRFLHHMVRYLVGTMVDAARGRRPVTDVAGLLDEDRLDELETSPPAPARGLFLARVYYDDEPPNPEGPENADLP
jgi:tRNA pseudouridine38-40 synthase